MTGPWPLRRGVLIVDDDASTRMLLRAVVAQFPDLEVIAEAADGTDALALAEKHAPALILLDLRMPHLDGTQVLTEMMAAAPDTAVVVISATEPSASLPLLEQGAVAFLPKGLAPRDLVEQLSEIIHSTFDAESGVASAEYEAVTSEPLPPRRSSVRSVEIRTEVP